ncbi:hemicentin-2-like [Centruroides sculpturatus]|uniref:hemicentin-2-like n=1 Tax=Centruroides sculpturatus TaxID=218467 RepID=UPI000C6CAC89|nr:hemicentin-2-like [Centruroides sculpturatus]
MANVRLTVWQASRRYRGIFYYLWPFTSSNMELWRLLWILCAFWVSGTSPLQEFDTTPVDTEVNPGDTTVLICKVRNRKGECAWLKDGRVVGKIQNKYDFEREPSDGDCSIRIRNSRIEDDDGRWECQVTQTSLTELTLTSPEIKYTVREAPMAPRIEDNTIQLNPGDSYRTRSGDSKRIHCVSRKGNPPAVLKWYIDGVDITSMSNQTNTTDVDKAKTWQAISLLDYTFHKEHNGKSLQCRAYHPAYEKEYLDITVLLEVLYSPIIKLIGNTKEDIEEGKSLSLKCEADANPKANIIWRKSGNSGIYDIKDQIDFSPIKRTDTGIYSCSAKNDVGQSEELEVTVKSIKPKILRVDPSPASTVALYNSTKLLCVAEGNPVPKYSWLQKIGGEPLVWLERGNNSTLFVSNVTYMYQGHYICEVSNVINGNEYKATSEEITLDVTGAPQVLTNTTKTKKRVVVEKDEDATMTVFFCSDPQPRRTFWEWGSSKLDTGSDLVRYIAEPLLPDLRQGDCYEARLIIQQVDGTDSRKYTLNVENDKGRESYAVLLEVREPVAMSVVIGIVVGCIVLLIIVVLVVLYLLKSDRLCFSRKQRFKTDAGSESDSGHSSELPPPNRSVGAIPPDALYASPKRNTPVLVTATEPHYENLKSERGNGSVLYAHLDLSSNGSARSIARPRQEIIEYAEIQFQPKVNDQIDL